MIGSHDGSEGTVIVTGTGSTWNNVYSLGVGHAGTAKLIIEAGGAVSSPGATIGSSTGTGTVSVTGAGSEWNNSAVAIWPNLPGLYVGEGYQGYGTGTDALTIENGGKVSTAFVSLAYSSQDKLTVSSGGKLTALYLEIGTRTGGSPVIIDGGILQATGNEANYLHGFGDGDLTILAGGLTFDTQAYEVGMGAAMDGQGGLTKIGAGTLVLKGANTYAGTTTVAAGTLALQNGRAIADTGAVVVNADGTLNLLASETIGSLAGPGAVLLNSNTLRTGGDDTNTVFGGVVKGSGGLTKIGTGTLTLTGADTYTGNTNIAEGVLILDGSLASVTTSVERAAVLGGHGRIGGALINGGVVSPGNSPGTLTIGGNFTQTAAGSLRIEIGGSKPSAHDLVAVRGRATLDGTLQLIRLNEFNLRANDCIVFLTAARGVTGKFATVENEFNTGTTVSGRVLYRENDVALALVQESFAAVPQLIEEQFSQAGLPSELTPNQRAVARGLDQLLSRNGSGDRLVEFLNKRLLTQLPGDFDAIAPEELASIYTVATSLANVQGINLQRRTESLRSGATGFNASGFAMNGSGPSYNGPLEPVSAGPDAKEVKTIVTPEQDPRWGAFLSGTGEWIGVDSTDNSSGYDVETGGFTLGADYRVSPTFAVGLSAGYAGTGANLENGGRVRVNGGEFGLYATYFTGGFYTDLAVNGGCNSYDTKRAGLEDTARGSTEGSELSALFGTGYDFQIGKLKIGPSASLQYTYIGLDSFKEHGSLAPLEFPGQSEESLRSALGLKVSYECQLLGMTVRPELRTAWQHEFGDETFAFDASLPNAAGNVFTTRGPRIGRDSLLLGAGFSVQYNESTAVYLSYDVQLLRENYESHSIFGGVRVAF